jgi:sensor histidine kinase regulating citrate/malate metabolism
MLKSGNTNGISLFHERKNLMRFLRSPMRLHYKVVILALLLVMISLLISGLQVQRTIIKPLREQTEEHAMFVAKLLASIPEIRYNLGEEQGSVVIQALAEVYREQTGVLAITVTDMEGTRYSHPMLEYVNKPFQGEGIEEALKGKSFVSGFKGPLGYQVRAFAPVIKGATQIGTVSVSILANDITKLQSVLSRRLFVALVMGLMLGGFGALFLAGNIKRSIAGLEPHEIVRLFKEREGILESVREGIIAIDEKGSINLVNQSARNILDLRSGIKGKSIREIIPNMKLMEVLETGKAVFDLEQNILDKRVLTNQVPIEFNGKNIGAIASFRDMTEITAMAEELTGVRRYVEALRVYNHEFMNKLHTISGLIHMGRSSKALECISESTETWQDTMTFITKRIKNPSVGGLLLGKMGRCRELGIDLEIDETSYLELYGNIESNSLVVIIGNLLENSIHAVMTAGKKEKLIRFSIFEHPGMILIRVYDEGSGIDPANTEKIFNKGFTTKKEGGGYGLYKVKEIVSLYGGEIEVNTEDGIYVEFLVTLPTDMAGKNGEENG